MKPALIILAAGMGSRYGGLKQMDGVGPNGETILDYSVYTARFPNNHRHSVSHDRKTISAIPNARFFSLQSP